MKKRNEEQQSSADAERVCQIRLVIQDTCVCCGRPVPEGRMVCLNCERYGGRAGKR